MLHNVQAGYKDKGNANFSINYRQSGSKIELIEKVITYKFPQKSRQELEQMFTLTDWQQTRFYQDAKKEGEEIGKQIGEQIGEQKAKLETVPLLLKLGLTPEQIAL